VAHWYGILADLKPVSALAKESGALLVEDAAQSLGAGREGEPSGGRGAFGVLSFGRGKGVTGGRGGALLLNDPEAKRTFADQDAGLHQGGIGLVEFPPLLAQFVFARPALYRLPASLPFLGLGETPFHLPRPPSGMSALSAGVLGRTWELAAAELELRRRNAARLLRSLPSHGLVGIAGAPQDGPGYLRLPVLDRGDGTRFASRPARDLGIMPGYPLSLGDLPGFTNRVLNPDSPLSGARLLAQRLGTLPTHSRLREIDLVRLEAWLTAPA
jgi:dTDP-4-amino-4,6-dideoxygalactose transaminase